MAASPCTLYCLLCSTHNAAAHAVDSCQLPDDLQFTENSVGAPLNLAGADAAAADDAAVAAADDAADAAAAAAAISARLLSQQASVTVHVCVHPHLDMRSAGADSCQPLALAKVAVNAQFQRALDQLTLVVLNLVMSLVHVHCQVLEVTGQSACQ